MSKGLRARARSSFFVMCRRKEDEFECLRQPSPGQGLDSKEGGRGELV